MPKLSLSILVSLVLLVAAVSSLHRVYDFGQHRFFTMDEYQFGHATWLVSQGKKPYLDFYEHHFPMSYALHAPLYIGEPSVEPETTFSALALRLRKIVFAYILLACLLSAAATFTVGRQSGAEGRGAGKGRSWQEALLAGFFPLLLGFGLMSAIDYRADSIAAFVFLACLFVLEINRRARRTAIAIGCGVALMVCAFMTQKIAMVGGVTIAGMLGFDLVQRKRSDATGHGDPLIALPGALILAAGMTLLTILAFAASLGLIEEGFKITILQAFEHEAIYPAVSVARFFEPYFSMTWYTTIPIAAFAAVYLLSPSSVFWRWAVFVAVVGGIGIKAQYPYNYIYLSFLIGLCGVRGYALLVRSCKLSLGLSRFRPLLYLLPLALIPNQLNFVSQTTGNRHQLELLDLIQRHTDEGDFVIDNAGGALFRKSASFYFQHGDFHRSVFRDYFKNQLSADYRRSEAPFWIKDMRSDNLPRNARSYLQEHYVQVGETSLRALGFEFLADAQQRREFEFEVVRSGDYYLYPASNLTEAAGRQGHSGIEIDGARVDKMIRGLDKGKHIAMLEPGFGDYVLSILPPDAVPAPNPSLARKQHTRLFEYFVHE